MRIEISDRLPEDAYCSSEAMDDLNKRLLQYRITLSVLEALHEENRIAEKPFKKMLEII